MNVSVCSQAYYGGTFYWWEAQHVPFAWNKKINWSGHLSKNLYAVLAKLTISEWVGKQVGLFLIIFLTLLLLNIN